jgi:adenosylmethionine-8-amino-7-oxononanoate aminotransferase
VSNTNAFRHELADDPAAHVAQLLQEMERAIVEAGPETVAMIIAEPVQNAAGCLVPPDGYWTGLREIADRYGIALVADEVITGFGRIGEWFAASRFGPAPDIITLAKGLTSAYAPMGALIATDRVYEPFSKGTESFTHGFTFGGHPVAAAAAMATIDVYEREDIPGHVLRKQDEFRGMLDGLRDLPIVGDVRGDGFFHAIELVKDQETKEGFTDQESEHLLRGFLSGELYRRGLICRADDRGDPVIQLAPPLICDTEQFDEIEAVLRPVLTEASERIDGGFKTEDL